MANLVGTTIFQLILLLTWTCLDTVGEKQKHVVYGKVLSSYEALEQLLTSASVVFAPGLFEVLQAISPPTIAYFKGLPSGYLKLWAIYLLVLEQDGRRPKIYIGSATEAKAESDGDFTYVSLNVQKALQDGYTITHKGLLCTAPIPPAAFVPCYRVLFVALEATFTFLFWAMYTKSKHGYGMMDFCPWNIDQLEYDGLCSHSALLELPLGDHELTPEELEAQAIKSREKQLEYHPENYRKRKAADPIAFNAKAAKQLKTSRDKVRPEFRAKQRVLQTKSRARVKKAKKFHCNVCDHSYKNKVDLNYHLNTELHANALLGIFPEPTSPGAKERHDRTLNKARASKKYYCAVCDLPCGKKNDLAKHNKTARHIAKAEAAAAAAAADSKMDSTTDSETESDFDSETESEMDDA